MTRFYSYKLFFLYEIWMIAYGVWFLSSEQQLYNIAAVLSNGQTKNKPLLFLHSRTQPEKGIKVRRITLKL